MMNFIKNAWNGEIKVWQAFLLWALHGVPRFFAFAFATEQRDLVKDAWEIYAYISFYYLLISPYVILVHVSFWRCIQKSKPEKKGHFLSLKGTWYQMWEFYVLVSGVLFTWTLLPIEAYIWSIK